MAKSESSFYPGKGREVYKLMLQLLDFPLDVPLDTLEWLAGTLLLYPYIIPLLLLSGIMAGVVQKNLM